MGIFMEIAGDLKVMEVHQKKDGLKNIAVKAYSRRENLIPINSGLKTSTILTVICLVLVQVVEASGLTLAEIS